MTPVEKPRIARPVAEIALAEMWGVRWLRSVGMVKSF
jgi:hypothetical protein